MPQIKTLFFLLLGFAFSTDALSQNFGILRFGTEPTLDIITWNLEYFPKDGQTTISYLTSAIQAIDPDIVACQEIEDVNLFNQLIANLDGYEGYTGPDDYLNLAFIYKTGTVSINSIYEIYTTSQYASQFPRPPLVMDFTFQGHNFYLINNHLKCCGDGIMDTGDPDDEETRRYRACNLLRQYIITNLPEEMVLVAGDMNDELTDNVSDNVFQLIINDTENFRFADMQIAEGSSAGWSYPSWPSHIDHIFVTNELFSALDNTGSAVETIRVDDAFQGGYWVYQDYISDHRPVGIKLSLPADLGTETPALSNNSLICAPNPSKEDISVTFPILQNEASLTLTDIHGRLLGQWTIGKGNSKALLNSREFPEGLYFIRLSEADGNHHVARVVLKR